MSAAEFQNVTKQYRVGWLGRSSLTALNGVSLAIPNGTVFGLLGPNRAGKTTLIKLLLSLTRPTAGQISRLGQPLRDRRSLARVGYVHENHAFPKYLSARELLRLHGGLAGVERSQLSQAVDAQLERVGLQDRADEPIGRFSKGMVQRLGLAQALINNPSLLILDEPTEGLDLFGRQLLRDLILERKQAGQTVILVTHIAEEVGQLCDRLAVLLGGQLAFEGTQAELFRHSGQNQLEPALKAVYSGNVRGSTR